MTVRRNRGLTFTTPMEMCAWTRSIKPVFQCHCLFQILLDNYFSNVLSGCQEVGSTYTTFWSSWLSVHKSCQWHSLVFIHCSDSVHQVANLKWLLSRFQSLYQVKSMPCPLHISDHEQASDPVTLSWMIAIKYETVCWLWSWILPVDYSPRNLSSFEKSSQPQSEREPLFQERSIARMNCRFLQDKQGCHLLLPISHTSVSPSLFPHDQVRLTSFQWPPLNSLEVLTLAP